MELSFSIDPTSFTKMFSGRSILPENLEEYGELNDFQIEKDNPYSRDNLICPDCEEKLSRLEAIFASEFTEKKIYSIYNNPESFIDSHPVIINKKYDHSLYELLIQSIFYRCSIGRFNGFRLNVIIEKKIEENLRQAFLIPDFKKVQISYSIEISHSFPIITSCLSTPTGDDPTKQFIINNQSRFPYFIMAGKWLFQIFEHAKQIKSSTEWFYGLKDKFNASKFYDLVLNKSHVILLNYEASEYISQNLIEDFTKRRIIWLKKTIRDLHYHIFKFKPTPIIAQYIYSRYFIHFKNPESEFKSLVHAFYDLRLLPFSFHYWQKYTK